MWARERNRIAFRVAAFENAKYIFVSSINGNSFFGIIFLVQEGNFVPLSLMSK